MIQLLDISDISIKSCEHLYDEIVEMLLRIVA